MSNIFTFRQLHRIESRRLERDWPLEFHNAVTLKISVILFQLWLEAVTILIKMLHMLRYWHVYIFNTLHICSFPFATPRNADMSCKSTVSIVTSRGRTHVGNYQVHRYNRVIDEFIARDKVRTRVIRYIWLSRLHSSCVLFL